MKPEITHIAYSTALTFELVTHYDFLNSGCADISIPTKRSNL